AWANIKIYVSAVVQGTQFMGDLTYTENGCTVNYHAVGMWPAVPCGDMRDDQGNPTTAGNPLDEACSPCANPADQFFTGSGTRRPNPAAHSSPGSATTPASPPLCDPALLSCVLANSQTPHPPASSIPQLSSSPATCGEVSN